MDPRIFCLHMYRIYKYIDILLNYSSVFDLKSSQVYSFVPHYWGLFYVKRVWLKSIPCIARGKAYLKRSQVLHIAMLI